MMEGVVREYVKDETEGYGKAYTGRIDWSADSDI
jgi:hypothetical protein